MSSYQGAKEALGVRFRELRLDARLTGRQLAASQNWNPSKVSKIEAGRQKPTDADLEAWTNTCGRPELYLELVASLRSLEEMYVEFRRLFRAGLASQQTARGRLERTTTLTRNFEHCFVPGLLQTAEYARYRLGEGG